MHKLAYYINKYNHLSPQGSTEWLDGRTWCFGGSEMATVCGLNKYEKFDTLIHNKIHKIHAHSDSTIFGVWFEPIAKTFITKEYGKIYEFGSISHPFYPIAYSPDGLMVIDNELVLLEIKNPIMRGVQTVPESYELQVKTGMNVINVKYCLFAQYRFRRCLYGTKVLNCTYDRFYHKEFRKRCKDKFPISYGYLYWSTEDSPMIDLATFDTMYDKIKDLPSPKVYIEEDCNETKGIILQWKLFDKSFTKIQPDKHFLINKEEFLWHQYEQLYNKNIHKD